MIHLHANNVTSNLMPREQCDQIGRYVKTAVHII